jgi:hypothetical protein
VSRWCPFFVANDAATLLASLHGVHRSTGEPVETRRCDWLSYSDPQRAEQAERASRLVARRSV